MIRVLSLACVLAALAAACGGGTATSSTPESGTVDDLSSLPTSRVADDPLPPAGSPYDALPEEARSHLDKPFTGDFDEMVKRRVFRAGVVYNRTHYFIDRGTQRGISYESLKLFEDEVNKRLKTGLRRIHVAIVPMSRDKLLPALAAGEVDVVTAALTITPERSKVVDFSQPTRSGVSEVVVTAPGVAAPATVDDLSGREVFVRRSSSYYESLTALNAALAARGKAPVVIKAAPEALEDDDILEMVNAGLVEMTVVDDYLAEFWNEVFTEVRVHPDVAVRSGGDIAVAVRKGNPRMLAAVNQWIKAYGPRTAFGNTIERRYLQSTKYVTGAQMQAERDRFSGLVKLFRTYGDQYSVDYLLMAAQGYQESRLDHSARSSVGAIGVMQIMPATGRDLKVGDITQLEPNIHGGIKYFRFMQNEFFADDPMDELNKALMTFASYNAGPGRIRQLRRETERRGLNPNVWFGNVEQIVSERIGRETVTYVSNIYKYYVAYRLSLESSVEEAKARQEFQQQ